MESVAAVLQFKNDLIIGNRNSDDLHPEIEALIGRDRVPVKNISFRPEIIAKASLGFGDVNACVIFRRFNP
jgi:3-oxoacyl-(acyl-carrier-protein) synthase